MTVFVVRRLPDGPGDNHEIIGVASSPEAAVAMRAHYCESPTLYCDRWAKDNGSQIKADRISVTPFQLDGR